MCITLQKILDFGRILVYNTGRYQIVASALGTKRDEESPNTQSLHRNCMQGHR